MILRHQHIHTQHLDCLPLFLLSLQHLHHLLLLYQKRPRFATFFDRLLVFFEKTISGVDGITHCGIYVGDGFMLHCGSPIGYADLRDSYWQQHFFGYGRLARD
ncbi:MAG: C40 family peptidase, partial [Clostridiales bacterium]|nr:C40 family peptidase [Clostridiales bacterium]